MRERRDTNEKTFRQREGKWLEEIALRYTEEREKGEKEKERKKERKRKERERFLFEKYFVNPFFLSLFQNTLSTSKTFFFFLSPKRKSGLTNSSHTSCGNLSTPIPMGIFHSSE